MGRVEVTLSKVRVSKGKVGGVWGCESEISCEGAGRVG